MRTPKLKLMALAVGLALGGNALAADFLQTYQLAKQSDPQFGSARASLEAGLEKLPQGRALLLPVINASGNTNWNDARNVTNNRDVSFNSNGWNVTLTQPIFRWQNLVQYQQSQYQVLQAEAQFSQATQDLIVRVAQAYFDVLAAQDNLEFTKGNKIAIAEQLAQAKRNFEVGTATITDTNEAQARFDLATAQEIAAINALEVAQRALQQIIGQFPDQLTPLRSRVVMDAPQPNVMDEWVKSARASNMVVKGNEAVMEIASREVERQRAGHYPTLDAVASYQDNKTLNPAAAFAGANISRSEVQQGAVGLQLTVPLYSGGSVLSRTREAVGLKEKARQDLDASRRAAEFNARQSYLNVTNGIAQVKALEQALASSEVSLQSNRVGYEVGVRINIDVLNAQQQVLQTQRDLARARYDTILNGLKLKSAAGALTEGDVEIVNRLLGFEDRPSAPARTGQLEPAAPMAAPSAARRSGPIAAPATTDTPLATGEPAEPPAPAEPRAAEIPTKPMGEPAATGSSQLREKTAKMAGTPTVAVATRADSPVADRAPEPEVQAVRYYIEPKIPEAVTTVVTPASTADASPAASPGSSAGER
jgi:outer membrane protein